MRLTAALLALISLAATYRMTPQSAGKLLADARPGDSLVLADGQYGSLEISKPDLTLVALNRRAPVVQGIRFHGARGSTVEGVTVLAPAGHVAAVWFDAASADNTISDVLVAPGAPWGVFIEGDRNRILRSEIRGTIHQGVLFRCPTKDSPCSDPPSGNLIEQTEIADGQGDGVKFEGDAGLSNVLRYNLIHDNARNGILEGPARETLIERNDIVRNGRAVSYRGLMHRGNGMYLKGQSSIVRYNRVIENGGYGISCWAACFGTPEKPYRIEGNRICLSGYGNLRIGGSAGEASPPGDGFPHYLEVGGNDCGDGAL